MKDIRWSVNEVSKVGSYLEVSGEGARPTRFFYAPPKDFFGSDEFSLRMSEGDRSSILKFKVDVTGVPDAPRFISEVEEMITVEEATPVEIHLNAVDPEGDNLKFQLISPVWDLDPWIELVHGEKVGEILLTGTPVVSANGNFFPYRVLAIDETGRFDQLAINFRWRVIIENQVSLSGTRLYYFLIRRKCNQFIA